MDERTGPAAQKLAPGPVAFHAALIAPALAFFAPHLFFGRALFVRDTALYFAPHRALISAALLHGRLPQWSPLEYAGLELLGDANLSVFHPLPLLAGLFPLPWGYGLYAFCASLLGAYGAAFLARSLGFGRTAQLVAGLAFAWSGPFVSLIESGQFLVLAMAPWLCAAAVRCAQGSGPAGLAPCALAAALTVFAGTPELGVCAFGLALVLAAAERRAGLPRVGLAFALGLGVAAVQIVPLLAFLPVSGRAGGFEPGHALSSSLALARLPELLVPFFTGAPDAAGLRSWVLDAHQVPWIDCVHLGAVVLALALAATHRAARAALVFAVLLLGLALGGETPLTAWIWTHAPGLRWLRFPDKLVGLVPLAVAVAAASGWERASAPRARRWGAVAAVAGLFALAAPLLLRAWFLPGLGARPRASFADTALSTIPAELALLAAAALLWALQRRLSGRSRAALWGLLLACDLGIPAARLDLTVPAAELRRTPAAAAALLAELGSDAALYRVDSQPSGVTPEQADRLGDPSWPRPRKLFWLRREGLEAAIPELGALHLARGYSGLTPGPVRQLFTAGGPAALDALSIRYGLDVGAPGRSPYASAGFVPVGAVAGGWVRVWRNPRAAPRVRLVAGAVPYDPRAPAPHCAAISLSPAELAGVAAGLRAQGCAEVGPAPGTASLAREEPERVELAVDARSAALIVLGDALVDGWRVEVDGRPARALAADGALRAVEVPPGAHAVVWRYRAPGLAAGGLVSLFALLACALLARRARTVARRERS